MLQVESGTRHENAAVILFEDSRAGFLEVSEASDVCANMKNHITSNRDPTIMEILLFA